MEILKFDESGASSPSRKRSGRSAILVTFVALVFGAGTALASGTLTINNNNTVALDQGVANSVQCDTAIKVSLKTNYNTDTEDFVYTGVDISEISSDCLGKYFTIHTYDEQGYSKIFCESSVDLGCASDGLSAKIQLTGSATTLSYAFTKNLPTGTLTAGTTRVNVKTVTVESSDS